MLIGFVVVVGYLSTGLLAGSCLYRNGWYQHNWEGDPTVGGLVGFLAGCAVIGPMAGIFAICGWLLKRPFWDRPLKPKTPQREQPIAEDAEFKAAAEREIEELLR